MNRQLILVVGFGVLFLLFVQMAGTLVESIYILNLLKSSMNAKVLGVLFFFSPILLLAFRKQAPRWLIWVVFGLLFVARGITPYLNTPGRLLSSGVGTGAALVLIPLFLTVYLKTGQPSEGIIPGQGLALAIGLSVLLRTVNYILDISLEAGGNWLGWALGLILGLILAGSPRVDDQEPAPAGKGAASGAVGVVSILTLAYFAFSSPGVIARWTDGNYRAIVCSVSFLCLLWAFIAWLKPTWIGSLKPWLLIAWNLAFTLALSGLILSHTVKFPATLASPAVVAPATLAYQPVLLALMLLLFPVIFFDVSVFAQVIIQSHSSPRRIAPGFILGAFILVLLVFMNIFTNVWGYVAPVSTVFRNKYWLPFLLITGLVTLLIAWSRFRPVPMEAKTSQKKPALLVPGFVLAGIFIGTLIGALMTDRPLTPGPDKNTLKVMTYNMQQANDVNGEKSYQGQLALMREVNPDILALQESDSARISLGNNDYVRYYANKLGYYTYYGPKTVTGTFGTALLSRYPLENARSFFTYSDQDENGGVEAQVQVGGRRFTIFVVHPDASDEGMLAFARSLLELAKDQTNVIAMGDYNLRGWEEPYQLINGVYKNAWMEVYPTGIDQNGLDMSGRNRIDHIFVSQNLAIQNPMYLLPPQSFTDHPAHWAEISW